MPWGRDCSVGLDVPGCGQHLTASVIVDGSHGNSKRDPARQSKVLSCLCEQVEQGQTAIRGVMLASHLVTGSQQVVAGQPLTYGQSITDSCLSLRDTAPQLQQLATAVRRFAGR